VDGSTKEEKSKRSAEKASGCHFAGEHTSLDHRWIEVAVESAIRTATEIAG
jgi:monoamine oxidase